MTLFIGNVELNQPVTVPYRHCTSKVNLRTHKKKVMGNLEVQPSHSSTIENNPPVVPDTAADFNKLCSSE